MEPPPPPPQVAKMNLSSPSSRPPPPKVARMTLSSPPPPPLPPSLVSMSGDTCDPQDGVCDRISELPSNILCSILFLLPIKEAGRTTTLSTRWRQVFVYSPVDLDDEKVSKRRLAGRPSEITANANRVAVITRIVAAHRGPICRVRLAKTRFHGDGDNTYGGVGLATDLFVGRNVEELILHSTHSVQFFPADRLRSLHLIGCAWFPSQPPAATFSRIKELTLRGVKISEPDLHALMEQCPMLEDLTLSSYHEEGRRGSMHHEQVDIARFLVRSNSLRNLSLELCSLAELVVVDAPNLEHLLGITIPHQRNRCAVILAHAPKLQNLGCLCTHFNLLFYKTYRIEGTDVLLPVARPPIRSMKILSVRVNLWDLGRLGGLARAAAWPGEASWSTMVRRCGVTDGLADSAVAVGQLMGSDTARSAQGGVVRR
ncbi:hypothetical protein GUJ93_ZPchr0005g14571 [Zizania palustris]|uniref:F-box domain-containing protein n=1 Tax=Zizania palustris TaxID=103762 RepID=A0A8J5T784_ZIZPA|nr:hypothetical protein GUJ93_ZPchr0005g14571 [Zizania palustris]